MASVIDRWSVSRSTEKSNVSPPTSPAGSSHPATVNWPPSQVNEPDLGRQRQRDRAAAPLEEVGVAAVGDDDVGQGVGRQPDGGAGLLVGFVGQAQLQHADGLAPARDRRVHRGAPFLSDHHDGLLLQRPPVRGAVDRDVLGRGAVRRAVLPRSQADERAPAEVGDEEADLLGGERLRQDRADDVGRRDRRGGLDRLQEGVQLQW
jgi:hypothetical protein